ncbi:GNAT family N-acetyltransferase [Saccharopolyspora rosea]|uniref:GNAT family N-acetyltransferase n=1 Tax=Saccharopolyspora rosea TaxID=524884 RepID=A0ABW3FY47_9PSEU|nr:GNAT family N-acetyltransferase [Saccharopolyspora rosea]
MTARRCAVPGETGPVREIERAAAATWPATAVEHVDGWLLRHCDLLHRRRSNSALPPAVVDHPQRAVERVEEFYAARGARTIIQVSPLEWHGELDRFLGARGYRAVAPTALMRAEVADVPPPAGRFEVRLDERPDERWLAACAAVGGRPEPSLDRIPQPVRFATATSGGAPVGVGVFAVTGRWCAVYGMATHPDWRRRGVARAVLGHGVRWASRCDGAVRVDAALLQVEAGNAGARRLYERAGFVESHRYHYRVLDR